LRDAIGSARESGRAPPERWLCRCPEFSNPGTGDGTERCTPGGEGRGNLAVQASEGTARALYPGTGTRHQLAPMDKAELGSKVPDEGQPENQPTSPSGNPRRGKSGPGVRRVTFSETTAQRAHAAPQRAPPDARDHAAARGVAAHSSWSAARDALDRAAAVTAASSSTVPCPDLSTPCVTTVAYARTQPCPRPDRLLGERRPTRAFYQ
jgi:hypothetical protein